MDITLLKDMLPFQYKYRIRVRVSRVWRPRKYNSDDYDGLHYVFVDESGDCVHAYINENQYDDMTEKVELGEIYDIFRFSTKDNNFLSIKIVNRDVDIQLNGATAFVRVERTDLQIPEHPYRFIEFEDLEEERKNQKTYTDIYGCIKTVKAPHEQPVSNKKRVETICEFTVENLRRRILSVTLWGETARAFDIQTVNRSSAAIFAIFTTLKLGEYRNRITASSTNHTCIFLNPIVAATESYNTEFSREGDRVQISGLIPNNGSPHQMEGQDHKNVSQLNTLNPQEYKNKIVTCNASIRRFPPRIGWWYRSCSASQCYKQLSKDEEENNEYFCTLHGLQKPRPSYRVYMTIEDKDSQATLTLMGRQAEQLFNSSCEDLVNKRFYPTEQTLPEEIVDKEGGAYHFEIRVNANHELMVRSLHLNIGLPTASVSDRTHCDKDSTKTVHEQQFTPGSRNKNNREAETEASSSSSPPQQRTTRTD